MSQEVTKLRKAGKIDEALELAQKLIEQNPENIWNRRALAWVYYELLKKAAEEKNTDTFIDYLVLINKLDLPADEKIFFKSIAWEIAKYVNSNNFENEQLDFLFNEMQKMPFPKPETSYTFIIKAFSKHAEQWDTFFEFIDWAGLDAFQNNDYEQTKLDNGKKILSDVERIYIAISKKLLQEPVDKQAIEKFLPDIQKICTEHPQMQYPHYYHAKLLLASGNTERFIKAFTPFAKKKKSDFWVWDLISEIFPKNDPRYLACLCRSLSCKAKTKFNLNVRQKLAEVLISKNMIAEAKHEINEIVNCRNKQGWKIPGKVQEWLKNETISKTQAVNNNKNLYAKYAPEADAILFYSIPAQLIVVDSVNYKNKIINFVSEKQNYGHFLYAGFNINPKPGDILQVRFFEQTGKSSNFYKAASIETSKQKPPEHILKNTAGTINIKEGNSFGFVNNYFVPPDIVGKYKLKNGEQITALVLKSYIKKKKEWKWKVIKIIQ